MRKPDSRTGGIDRSIALKSRGMPCMDPYIQQEPSKVIKDGIEWAADI